MDELCCLVKRNLDLLAALHILNSDHARVDLILAEEDNERNAQLVGVADLVLELLLLAVQLGTDVYKRQVPGLRCADRTGE